MDHVNAHQLHWGEPLAVLMGCPAPGCSGQVELHSSGRHERQAVGRCSTCGGQAVMRAGLVEPRPAATPSAARHGRRVARQ